MRLDVSDAEDHAFSESLDVVGIVGPMEVPIHASAVGARVRLDSIEVLVVGRREASGERGTGAAPEGRMVVDDIQDEIIGEMAALDEGLKKYRYLIEQGRQLQTPGGDLRREENLIPGCQSRVWIQVDRTPGGLRIRADSDAMIVRGVIALLVRVLDGQPAAVVAEAPLHFVDATGLSAHLSPHRANGLAAMVHHIRSCARRHLGGDPEPGAVPGAGAERPHHRGPRGTPMSRTEVTTEQVERLCRDPRCQIIDARSSAAYNGWALQGEPRGGHIPGARSLPQAWTRYLDWVEALEPKGLTPDLPTVVYADNDTTAARMADNLLALGFTDVRVYPAFITEWVGDPRRPLERLPRYRQLVPPSWLHALIGAGAPPEWDGGDWVICHAHFDNEPDYHQGHVPGALPLNTNWLESTETWDRRSPDELREALLGLGVRHDTTVVLYGRFSNPRYEHEDPGKYAGHLGAMRCAAILLYSGVADVRILDGGIMAWEAEGLPVSTEPVRPRPATDFGADIPGRSEYMIDTPEARALLGADDAALVSVRSWEEFIGEASGYHYIERKGRIPGAVFGDCGSDAYHMENYRNLDHTVRAADEVARRWAERGITPDKRIAFYCGTGWRGSEAFINAYLMGWPRIAVYDGGWFAWSCDPNNPIATGIPQQPPALAGK